MRREPGMFTGLMPRPSASDGEPLVGRQEPSPVTLSCAFCGRSYAVGGLLIGDGTDADGNPYTFACADFDCMRSRQRKSAPTPRDGRVTGEPFANKSAEWLGDGAAPDWMKRHRPGGAYVNGGTITGITITNPGPYFAPAPLVGVDPMSIDPCCEFTVDPESDDENTPETAWHYRRTCPACGYDEWWALHCQHDGIQRACPRCGVVPEPVKEHP